MKVSKELWMGCAVILFVGISALLFLPILPIDETRSLSVAWEMWIHKSFLVPLLKGHPYSHKPPLLFWLIHLSWVLFGVNEITPRLIPMLVGMANLFLVDRIARLLWPGDEKAARYAVLLLTGTLIWLVWTFLILYEMLLSFWVLVGVYGILSAHGKGGKRPWFFVSAGIAGGILTKGPVIFVHLLPTLLLISWWGNVRGKALVAWFGKALAAVLTGVVIAGFWVVPAVVWGGEAYRHAILWRQTAGRVVASFAHREPIWWYLPILPVLFLPWVFFGRAWKGLFRKEVKETVGWRVCVAWFVSSLVILSLVSGKQIYYPIPVIPAVILLLARNLSRRETAFPGVGLRPWVMGGLLSLLGVAAVCFPMVRLGGNLEKVSWLETLPLACVLLGFGLYFLARPFRSPGEALRGITLCVAIGLFVFFATTGRGILKRYDLKPLARLVGEKMKRGACVAFVGTYHGEFQFLGRLKEPVVELKGVSYKTYLKAHPDCLVIDTVRIRDMGGELKKIEFCYIQPFRRQRVIFMLGGRAFLEHFGR